HHESKQSFLTVHAFRLNDRALGRGLQGDPEHLGACFVPNGDLVIRGCGEGAGSYCERCGFPNDH
ncbi:MAG: hypothetical protein N3G20_11440, partial [Verrucomicrobiae bacterium]|nr:hypothetical protein [Verrucomicrobiae bacterium]